MNHGTPTRGGYQGGYQGGHYSEYVQQNTPGSSGRKRYRDDDGYPNDRGPQRRFNDYGSPRGRGRGRGGYRGYGGGGRGGDIDPEQAAAAAEERFCKHIWKLGDSERFDFRNEIPAVVRAVEDQWSRDPQPVFKAFRVAAVEMPLKLPHYALILSMLATSRPRPRVQERQVHTATGVTVINSSTEAPGVVDPVSIGLEVVKDLVKSFQSHLDGRRWRSTRLTLCLFAHLAALPSPLVSKSSLVGVLASFTAVWEELMGKAARGDECLKAIAEALLRGNLLGSAASEKAAGVDALLQSVQTYMASRKLERGLLHDEALTEQYNDPIENLAAALESRAFVSCLPTLTEPFAPELEARAAASSYPDPVDLPTILVPPEEDDDDGLEVGTSMNGSAGTANGASHGTIKKGPLRPEQKDRVDSFGAAVSIELFVDDTTPPKTSSNGVLIRSLLADVIDLFDVNRKECAAVLLDMPRWFARGTFRRANQPKPDAKPKKGHEDGDGRRNDDTDADESKPESQERPDESPYWILENCAVEAIFTAMLSLPTPPRRSIYYHSLVAELCRLAPQTVAPALGKCVRRLFAGLGQAELELDVDGKRPAILEPAGVARFAEWFSVHLSNFGFMWGWKDWQDHLALPPSHPKRQFIARTLELETRLSYFDRIKGTVPDSFVEAGIIPADAPAPSYEYEAEANEHHLAAADILLLMRRKEPLPRLIDYLDKMKDRLQQDPICMTGAQAEEKVRDVTAQALLFIGSRSFSHFLNILERYTLLLRKLTGSPAARVDLLQTVAKFWRRNAHFCSIVIDKLLDYRVVDPIDVVSFLFFEATAASDESAVVVKGWSGTLKWDVLKGTMDVVNGRVKEGRKALKDAKSKEEEKEGASKAADGDVDMDGVDDEKKQEDEAMKDPSEASDEIAVAERSLKSNRAEQESVICEVLKQFDVAVASANEAQGGNDGNGDERSWKTWWTVGWLKEFGRTYAVELAKHSGAVANVGLKDGDLTKRVVEQAQAWADFAGHKA